MDKVVNLHLPANMLLCHPALLLLLLLMWGCQMGRVRVRQHVNPLSSQFQQPAARVDWTRVYDDPNLPLFVDCGCGPGRFLLLLCRRHQQQQQQMNYLGLEIRQPVGTSLPPPPPPLGAMDLPQ
jgi:hypothetical protein